MNIDENGNIIDEAEKIKDLEVYCVYYDPTGFPMQYVLRKWLGLFPQNPPLYVGYDEMEMRKLIPNGLENMGPDTEEPKIIETWL